MDKLTDRPNMTLDVYRGRKTTTQQKKYFLNALGNQKVKHISPFLAKMNLSKKDLHVTIVMKVSDLNTCTICMCTMVLHRKKNILTPPLKSRARLFKALLA